MGRVKPKFTPEPRVYNLGQVLAVLNKSDDWWKKNSATLAQKGFPRYDALLSGWDAEAIHRWMDHRSGLDSQNADIGTIDYDGQILDEAIRARKAQVRHS